MSIGEIGGDMDPLKIELVFYMIYIDKEGIRTIPKMKNSEKF